MSNQPVFIFKNLEIRTAIIHGETWFVAKDVCAALNISWTSATLKPIPEAWKGGMNFITPFGKQLIRIISEPAVYKLAFRSNKPEADAFTNWVASEVLPAIRKTGKYEARAEPKQKALPPGGRRKFKPEGGIQPEMFHRLHAASKEFYAVYDELCACVVAGHRHENDYNVAEVSGLSAMLNAIRSARYSIETILHSWNWVYFSSMERGGFPLPEEDREVAKLTVKRHREEIERLMGWKPPKGLASRL